VSDKIREKEKFGLIGLTLKGLRVFFKVFFLKKYIKNIFYFLKFIFILTNQNKFKNI
jgi:hypothetical protein